jgi:hypothetical protein
MSAFGGKADMTVCGNPLSRRYWGQSGRRLAIERRLAKMPKRSASAFRSNLLALADAVIE